MMNYRHQTCSENATILNRVIFTSALTLVLIGYLCSRTNSEQSEAVTAVIIAEGFAVVQKNDLPLARFHAIEDALRSSVEQALGMMVSSETVVENYEAFEKIFFSRPKEYIKTYEILEEKLSDDLYRVKIKAVVSSAMITYDLCRFGLVMARMPYPTPQEIAEIVEAELKDLAVGRVLFNPSDAMRVGVRERVEVRISQSITEDLFNGLKGRGIPQVEKIKVGPFMKATLTGDGFNIIALSHDEQVITKQGFTHRDWDVIPLESGFHSLALHISVRIKIPGFDEETKDYPVFERKIKVRINMVYSIASFMKSYWQWIASTILGTGVIGWLVRRKKKPRTQK